MFEALKAFVRAVVPAATLARALSAYHFALAALAAIWHGYPARSMLVVGVTGTKGKTSVAEMVSAILEKAGYATCVADSIRFKQGKNSRPNPTRMSMPGRFFIQKFLHDALRGGCTAAILEMTSEGARQYRHRFLDLDALIFTNLAPEHIESHGSYEAYADAKFELGRQIARSRKRPRIVVADADDKESGRYLTLPVEHALPFSLAACAPFSASGEGGYFTFENARVAIGLPGEFSLKNALAAATLARALGIPAPVIAEALGGMGDIPGRAERIEAGTASAAPGAAEAGKQDFTVVVDYAHTPDSLAALYDAYKNARKICVLSAAGGGRDAWKRPVMGRIANERCAEVILTDEDPYDEDPRQIVNDIAHGMKKPPEIVMDRREAIRRALEIAETGDAVLITGKGTDPSIRGPGGREVPWDDARVVREELEALLKKRAANRV
ncbi:hypothetical protein A3C21_01145 [Candidatus Kaiserbacteria bacterium RIFCSPHIGHO2_02_FULL_59_21]|uniref:UDP-N-acetylmuramyl-tripeptide synthetase n=2 Tax=Candidatus Kaiseribacteriota TaxID=1752734 RepID=A0A1F6DZV9_9BACT|nr:MAG: hypothetical protein A2766_02140 [Candidatus Kaiserbacteria bacterium RIFCSPHIGHO2_01_FULL_58_22]OGG66961.1 MAG: hypothetical protein A3C21_01145 [Candidatus Kaiserbacteria bacterium RIFCSPHIGHO2_02_FULL_59_21]OGG85669.1 MAG: hypothetical protein A3I47_00520 [Candidatus Kaiserbacteria bacterium RIFCSPLOWO2_02_FULL_59_19]